MLLNWFHYDVIFDDVAEAFGWQDVYEKVGMVPTMFEAVIHMSRITRTNLPEGRPIVGGGMYYLTGHIIAKWFVGTGEFDRDRFSLQQDINDPSDRHWEFQGSYSALGHLRGETQDTSTPWYDEFHKRIETRPVESPFERQYYEQTMSVVSLLYRWGLVG